MVMYLVCSLGQPLSDSGETVLTRLTILMTGGGCFHFLSLFLGLQRHCSFPFSTASYTSDSM